MYDNPWIYDNEPLLIPPQNAVGFVYIISDNIHDKLYIGKKLFFFSKSYQKNKKTKKKLVESDWKSYYGSNKTLINIVNQYDNNSFSRSIIHIAYSKSHAAYLESKEIFLRDAILSDKFYNDWVAAKITRNHMKKFQITT